MSRSSERVKRWRKNTKDRIVAAFGSRCGVCGYDRTSAALELHHLDPEEKEFSLGSIRSNIRSWAKIVTECRKCVLLCSNCHREYHQGLFELPNDIVRFDENYADYKEVRIRDKKDKCPICGGEKFLGSITCSRQCAGKKRHKVNWEIYDSILKEEIKKRSSWVKIADKIGNISDVAVKKRAVKIGLI